MLEAVKEEFHPKIQKKGSHKLLEDAIHALHTVAHLHPWMVTNGGKDGILANHRANLGTYIGEANTWWPPCKPSWPLIEKILWGEGQGSTYRKLPALPPHPPPNPQMAGSRGICNAPTSPVKRNSPPRRDSA